MVDHGRWATSDAKTSTGSNFPKIPEAWNAKTSAGIKFPPNSQNLGNYGPALPIDARTLGILGKFDPYQCFSISGFRNFGEIWGQHFSNLGCENIDRDQISPEFLKLEIRKHGQGSNFPQLPKIRATMAPALPIDARICWVFSEKFDPCQCFSISGFRNFGEIWGWQHFSNLGCEISTGIDIPQDS